jgi:hypothetical protein
VFFGINYAKEDKGSKIDEKCDTNKNYETFTKRFG